jgi:hypothetical protein
MPKVVFVETKRGVLKGWTHFKRDSPDLSNDATINGYLQCENNEFVFDEILNCIINL